MPRIQFNHPEIDEWCKQHDGTSTFDICNDCLDTLETASDFDTMPDGYNGDPIPADATIEDIKTPNPEIDEENYRCENCNCKLTSKNYY